MSEYQLDGNEHGREEQAHAEHDTGLGVIDVPQQVPGAGRCDAEGAGQISTQQHVRKTHPDHRVEEDPGPVIGGETGHFAGRSLTGTCIQLLLTMIQNAESVVPSDTIAVENR